MLKRLAVIAALSIAGPAFPQTQTAPWPSTPEEQAHMEQIARWVKQCLDVCGTDEPCKKVCTNTGAHSIGCAAGDRSACDERARDLADIGRINAQKRKPPTQKPAQDALMQCLQSTARSVAEECRKTNCDTALLVDMIGYAQIVFCGYSAIQPAQPIQPPGAGTPQTDYICAEQLMKGGMSWGIAMQACTR